MLALYGRIMPFLEKALERMPLLARYGIRREMGDWR